MTALTLMIAILLDRVFGELPKLHPLVGFGTLASTTEKILRSQSSSAFFLQCAGLLAWVMLVCVPAMAMWALMQILSNQALLAMLNIVALYFCLAARSLNQHAERIRLPLLTGDIAAARRQVGMIVSRDTKDMNRQDITKAAVESVLENGSDGIFAPLFWFLVAGAPGALAYRLANTLDAMWGYRNQSYRDFGRAAARLDDLLNWVPARICALGYAICGKIGPSLRCWRTQGRKTESPNAGVVMASGAGALEIRLGGNAYYGGVLLPRPELGTGAPAEPNDINRALRLIDKSLLLWILTCVVLETLR